MQALAMHSNSNSNTQWYNELHKPRRQHQVPDVIESVHTALRQSPAHSAAQCGDSWSVSRMRKWCIGLIPVCTNKVRANCNHRDRVFWPILTYGTCGRAVLTRQPKFMLSVLLRNRISGHFNVRRTICNACRRHQPLPKFWRNGAKWELGTDPSQHGV